jgi:hypothetical protein
VRTASTITAVLSSVTMVLLTGRVLRFGRRRPGGRRLSAARIWL